MPLVVLLASLFFVSCEDPGKIGLNINPDSGVILTKYKELILPSTQVQFDPRSTLNSFSFQAGKYSDPDFGTVSSKSYAWLGIDSSVPSLHETAKYGSISLSIQFSSIYGSEAENKEIESFDFYQLAGDIIPGSDYTRVDEILLGNPIGALDLMIQENDTLTIDSVFTIDLADEVGQAIFAKLAANDGTFDNDTLFNSYFKGIAIVPNTSNNKIIQFNPSSFKIELNYNETNADGEVLDRTYRFTLGSMKFFNLTSDLSGTPLNGILADNKDFIPSNDFRYLQSGTMISLKIDYNPLMEFMDTIENLSVQKAYLSVGDIPINQPGSAIPPSLVGYFTDENNKWPIITGSDADRNETYVTLQTELVPPTIYSNPQDISLGASDTLSYEATMSTFIQHLHGGGYNTSDTPLEQGGNLLLYTSSSIAGGASSPSHTVTNYFKVHKDSIKIKMYYSVPN